MDLTEEQIRQLLELISVYHQGPPTDKRARVKADHALSTLYRTFVPGLAKFLVKAWRRYMTMADVEEVVSMTFDEVWKKPTAFSGTSQFKTWLFGVGRNKAREWMRKNKSWHDRRESMAIIENEADDSVIPTPVEAHDKTELRQTIERCASRLPLDQREVLLLVYLHDCTLAEVIDICKCVEGTVKSRLYHARHNIRACLQSQLAMEESHEHAQ